VQHSDDADKQRLMWEDVDKNSRCRMPSIKDLTFGEFRA
jgi:hypothetical protein